MLAATAAPFAPAVMRGAALLRFMLGLNRLIFIRFGRILMAMAMMAVMVAMMMLLMMP